LTNPTNEYTIPPGKSEESLRRLIAFFAKYGFYEGNLFDAEETTLNTNVSEKGGKNEA
jgi:hypothetical protein